MRLTLACVGRLKAGAEKTLLDGYLGRLTWPVTIREVEEKRPLPPAERKKREAELLIKAVPAGARRIALDERGRALSSADFASLLKTWQEQGTAEVAFLIGGADGLDPELVSGAALRLSLGPMTWPHLLVRVMLAEQLYRAQSILAGHPYHRA